jgi:CHAT domain-containing protein
MPGLSLTNTSYRNIKNSSVLALGISKENMGLTPLPFVENELLNISKLWNGQFFFNEEATLEKITSREPNEKIIHISGQSIPGNSLIKLWGEDVDISREIDWYNPPVELLVLSACQTGLDIDYGGTETGLAPDYDELSTDYGLAGLAIQEGVKSVLGSLYNIPDETTMLMMTEFYRHLKSAPVKAEALRQAQLTMIRSEEFSNPYYWAGFTLIGNPW